MSSLAELERRIQQLEARQANSVRVGTVTAIMPEKGMVRVEFGDRGQLVSYELPVVVKQTLKNKDSYTPDVGEHVSCVFLGNGIEQGFVLGAIYSDKDTPLNNDPDVRRTDYEDGTYHSYDRKNSVHLMHYADGSEVKYDAKSNQLQVTVSGAGLVQVRCKEATVSADTSATIDTPTTTCTGNLVVEGSISYGAGMTGTGGATINGDFAAQGGAFTHNSKNVGSTHTHSGVQTGGSTTGEPT